MRMAGNAAVTALMSDMGGPDFTGMSNLGQKARTQEGIQSMKSDAEVDYAHMAGDAMLAKANMKADVIGAQSSAAGQQAMGDMIGQIGGSLGSAFGGMMGTGGGVTPASNVGDVKFAFNQPDLPASTYSKPGLFSPGSYGSNLFAGG